MEIIANEFAAVRIEVDATGNDRRLRIEDLVSGRVAYFDALELETLAWLRTEDRERYMDPSAHRWRADDGT